MADFLRKLPRVQNADKALEAADESLGSFKTLAKAETQVALPATCAAPSYGKRRGWTPRTLADFGDGGAFPEVHMAQYPLEMGKRPAGQAKVVPLQVDENGKMQWDAVIKQGSDKLQIWTRPEDAREKWTPTEELVRPTGELDLINTERTQKALELALNGKVQAGLPQKQEDKAPEFVRYTPNPNAPGYVENCKERVIRISEKPVDPLMPPKFKHKKVPRGPPSPPPPVHHSPARKLTAKDQKDWKIPPCVSNWKNAKGYTIPLDKRLAADGRNLQDVAVNDKFAALSEDLYLAERKAREEIKIRNDMIRQKKVREEEVREVQLRELAVQARQQRAELVAKGPQEGEDAKVAEDRTRRMEVLNDRKREIERDQRLELAGKKQKRGRDEDRDVSERIALGQVAQATGAEAIYDARLFNQSAGMDSGYHGGADDVNIAYDKALFADRTKGGQGIYQYDKERMEQQEGRLASIGQSSFQGTEGVGERGESRQGPVEFERDEAEHAPARDGDRTRNDERGRGDRDRSRHRERVRRDRSDDRDRDRDRRRRRDDKSPDPYGLNGLMEETKRTDRKR